MVDQNAELDELVVAIQAFCNKERSTARGSAPDRSISTGLRNLFNRLCPRLSLKFQDAPDIVYARRIIDYGVSGQNDPIQEAIWQEYFKRGSTLEDLENGIDSASRTARRLISVFAYKIAVQLLEKEMEIADPIQSQAETVEHRTQRILQDAYELSNRQAEVISAFCLYPDLNQNAICQQILFITDNTLRVHKRHILRLMEVRNMRQAVDKALKKLKEKVGNDWNKL